MANSSGGSSMDGAAGGNMATGKGGQRVTSSSHSGPGHMTRVPRARRRAHPPTRLGSEVPEPSQKKRKVVNEEAAPCGVPNAGKISAPYSAASRDPNKTSSSEDHAGGHTSEYATVGNARGSPIKRKCTRTSRYLRLFTPVKGQHTDEVKSKQSTVPTKTKKVNEFQKLQRLPDGCHPDFDNDHLCSVNKLLEFWHKSQGAVFVDDKEHVMKTILFISSVLPDAYHSFLLVTTSSLPLWKAEFSRFAPSINIVVFDGEKDVLKLIQNPKFHENGSHTMLHVLLAHPDVIIEDIKSVEGIVWESVIVDYCQDSVAKHLKQLKQLPTDFRMVLLSSPLKDSLPEYKNLLDFLNSEQEDIGDYIEADSLAMLRARFTRHIAYERKTGSSNFLEYWVPAYLSQVQLELYSSILLANSSVLQSQMTTDNVDNVGALCDVVMSLWKCCNHPCLVDLQRSPDDGMCASGKILLLEKMLKEIRNKSLRVIVLFQSNGAIGDRIGDILEDLVRHKFGPESYERVQNRSAFVMKQEAMNTFNDTTKGRFVFLIDSRACQPSINLSSIDSIIIYGSDLNPLNDLKALRKIKIGSQLKFVPIFRLYTPFTVEEKSLVLAKQSMIIDSNSQDITYSLSHCLVSWGVSVLFDRVDELQQDNCPSKSIERGTVFMDKVIFEFLTELSTEVEDSSKVNSTTISKAFMSGEFYSRNITLIGEREGVSSLDGDPPKFWLNLLDGKSCCQRYKPIKVTTEETSTSRRKRRNTCEIAGSSSKFRLDVINDDLIPEISSPSSADLHLLPETVENRSTPKSLHAELKRELSKLMMVLKLPDNVLFLANQFLEYLLKNHLVVREPRGILHSFNIALCWRAASFLKYTKLDRRESLALASDGLNYECNEELAEIFYKKIGILKEKVAHKPGGTINDRFSPHESSSANLRSGHKFPKQAMDLHGNFTNGTEDSPSATEQVVMVSNGQELVSAPDADIEQHLLSEESPRRAAMKRLELFNNIFSSRERDIIEKQQLEKLDLRTQRDNQVKKLKEVCHAVIQHIRISGIDEEMKIDQTKLVIQWFTMFMHSFLAHMKLQFCKLDALHSTTLAEEQLMKENFKQEVISSELDEFPDPCVTLPDSNSVIEDFIHFKKQNGDNHVGKNSALDGDQLLDDRLMEITLVRSSISPETCPTLEVRNEPTEAHMRSGGRAAPESVDLPDNNNQCSSDGIDYQRACSASSIPASHDSINQESSTGDGRSIEHAKGDNIANPSMFPGSAISLVVGINAENNSTVAADPDHLKSPILASPQSVTTLQHSTAEEEPSDTLLATAAQDLQTEMQTTCPTLGAQHQKVYPDDSCEVNDEPDTATGMLQEGTSDLLGDSSKMNIEPNTTTGMLQEGTTSDRLDDSGMGVEKNVDTVAADPLNSENQSYIAPNSLAAMPEAWVAERSSMPAQHSATLPAQRKLPTLVHPPEEADPSSNLDAEAAQTLQPDIQPSSSTLDADSSETRRQPETTTVPSEGGSKNQDVDNNGTVHAQKAHSESPIFAAPQSPAMLPLSLEAVQSNDVPSRHTHAVSESLGMLGTQAEQDLHPDVQEEDQTEYVTCTTSNLATLPFSGEAETENGQASVPAQEITSAHVQHSLATSQHPVGNLQPPTLILSEEAERAGLLCTSASQDLQTSVTTQENVPLERTDLSSRMPMIQSTNVLEGVEPSCDPHAEEAGTWGMLSAPDLQSGMQSSSPLQDQLAEAEGAGFSGTTPAQNLQPETQPDRGTALSEEGETEYLTCTTSNLAILPFPGEAETENGQASVPAQEITGPHVQHSLATSQHPVGNLQPPTLILSEEAERAGLLCTSASQDLQLSVSSQENVPLERADLSGMPMTQSTTVLQSVEPSCDPHAEEAGTFSLLSAPDLQSGMQSSSPLQDQLAEAEVADVSGTIPARNLQPETQPSTSAQHIPPETTHPDERIQIGLQRNTASGPGQLAQLSTVAPASLLCSSKPLINELEKLKYWNAVLSKNHEQKKSQLQTECNQEIEKVKEKYELLLQEEDSTYHRLTTDLNRIYKKVSVHQLLAESFQEFFKMHPVPERSASPTIWQAPPSSQHAPCGTTAAQTTLLPVASSLATRPPVLASSHTAVPYLQPSQVARPPASGAIQLQPVLPGNLFRAAPSPVGSMPPQDGIYRAVGAQPRGPAPHLEQLRMPAMVHRDEQRPGIINPGVIPSRQSAPGMFESSVSGNALAGIPLTSSMAPSSVHQAMPSTSNPNPAFPASSLLPGSGPESMANFEQSNSRIPVGMAGQQAPGLNPAFHHMGGGPLNAASGIRQAGAHIGGTAQIVPDQSQEVLRRLLQRLPQVMAPSSVHPTTSNSHPAPMASWQQAGFLNPAPDNMAGPLNAAAGVRYPVARVGNQSYQVSPSLVEWEALLRAGLIRGHQGTYPQRGADRTVGPPGTSPQGSSSTSREVVCLSDDE